MEAVTADLPLLLAGAPLFLTGLAWVVKCQVWHVSSHRGEERAAILFLARSICIPEVALPWHTTELLGASLQGAEASEGHVLESGVFGTVTGP